MKDKIFIISHKDIDVINVLKAFGYECIDVINSPFVSEEINYHADVLYLKIDNKFYISSCQKENFECILNLGFEIEEIDFLKKGYQTESYLNFIVNDEYVIKNNKTALNINFLNKKEIFVNQGYTRCSLISLNPNAYITEDLSIHKKLIQNNLDCLLIKKGSIKLDGYDYGFIGGASLYLEKEKTLLFFGDIKDSVDKENIIKFLDKYGINPYFIKDKELIDLGSGIIIEKEN